MLEQAISLLEEDLKLDRDMCDRSSGHTEYLTEEMIDELAKRRADWLLRVNVLVAAYRQASTAN